MNQFYNQDYTIEQIEAILETIKNCIGCNHYTISLNNNRSENIDFKNKYNLTSNKQKDILLKINPDDFCHSQKNTKLGYEDETLYVFCPQIMLFNYNDEEELVDIYIKFNIIDYNVTKRVITISFHKRNKPLNYLFR